MAGGVGISAFKRRCKNPIRARKMQNVMREIRREIGACNDMLRVGGEAAMRVWRPVRGAGCGPKPLLAPPAHAAARLPRASNGRTPPGCDGRRFGYGAHAARALQSTARGSASGKTGHARCGRRAPGAEAR